MRSMLAGTTLTLLCLSDADSQYTTFDTVHTYIIAGVPTKGVSLVQMTAP